MKHINRTTSTNIGVILLVIALLFASFIGGAWLGATKNSARTASGIGHENSGESDVTDENDMQVISKPEVYSLRDDDLIVTTPYGEICYSAKFEEFLRITHEFSKNLYVVNFNVDLGTGSEENIFSICYAADDGEQPDGTILGAITDDSGAVFLVILTINEGLPDSTWDEDTLNLFYAMQEEINYCVECLEKQECFILDQ